MATVLAGTLSQSSTVFSHCHSLISPQYYEEQARFDLCLCLKSPDADVEDCKKYLELAAQQYARMCGIRGVKLNWRSDVFARM